jgi:hypothetical protein
LRGGGNADTMAALTVPRSKIAADRREQLDLRHPRHRLASVSGQPMLPPPSVVSKLADIESIRSSVLSKWCRN